MEIVELQQALIDQLKDLKEINELNQELIHLSMQYVTMNLDLLMPND
ncbi:FlgN protein [Mycobacteroides abscessus subsp. abscessus]|nr:FlgN protein [Mycobacteroides abscessus subsp. abscessus]